MPSLKEVIERRLAETGRNPFEVAREGGLERNFVNDILIGKKRSVRGSSMSALAKGLGLSLTDLHALIDGGSAASPHAEIGAFKPAIIPGHELVGNRDFPIYAAAAGGDGHIIVTFDAIEYVKRPAILEGVKGAYGLLVYGDSMSPAYRHGDMALVHPGLGPASGEDVILYDHPPDGDTEAIIKHLKSWNEQVWRLEQFNPPREWTEYRADWPTCHRVVGSYKRRG